MPSINLERELYDELIRLGVDPAKFANEATREKMEKNKEEKRK